MLCLFHRNNAEESPRMYPLIGLHLLRFLVQHQLSDFHVLLERLSYSAINHNPYIKGPLVLEQFLMEGNFLKAWQACSNAPGDEYKFFMLLMMTSLR